MSLKSKLAFRFPIALVTFGTLPFLPAGSFRFWQGWVYIGIVFLPGLLVFVYFYKRDPQVLERRSLLKEKVPEQRRIMGVIYVTWMVALMLPGFDHRYGWSRLPLWFFVRSLLATPNTVRKLVFALCRLSGECRCLTSGTITNFRAGPRTCTKWNSAKTRQSALYGDEDQRNLSQIHTLRAFAQ